MRITAPEDGHCGHPAHFSPAAALIRPELSGRLGTLSPADARRGSAISADKRAIGSYYSPEPYARVLVRWALNGRPGLVLDPSYGGCAMLRVALDELRQLHAGNPAQLIFGADLDGETAQWTSHLVSQGVPEANLRRADFLSLRPGVDLPLAAAVVGNPPYVRHHRLVPDVRARAAAAAAEAGVRLSGRASLWAHFVVHASRFVDETGRLALLLPGAVLHADYASEVISYLRSQFDELLLVHVRERIFDDAQEETVALLATRGSAIGAAGTLRFAAVEDCASLERLLSNVSGDMGATTLDVVSNWKLSLLPSRSVKALERVLADERVQELSTVAQVSLGTVTGANDVFTLTNELVDTLDAGENVLPVVTRSAWLSGPELTRAELARRGGKGRSWLLTLPPEPAVDRRTKLGRHLTAAEQRGVHNRHHCQRTPWWSLDETPIPDAFLAYTVGYPRGLALNTAAAASTNTVHQVNWLQNPCRTDERSWTLSTWSTLSCLAAELFGRHYGGGVLKLELAAAHRLPIVHGLRASDRTWKECLRNPARTRAIADEVLQASGLGVSDEDLNALKAGARALMEVRTSLPTSERSLQRRLMAEGNGQA